MKASFIKRIQQRKHQLANSRQRVMRQNYNDFIKSSNNHIDQEVTNSLISKENPKKL